MKEKILRKLLKEAKMSMREFKFLFQFFREESIQHNKADKIKEIYCEGCIYDILAINDFYAKKQNNNKQAK